MYIFLNLYVNTFYVHVIKSVGFSVIVFILKEKRKHFGKFYMFNFTNCVTVD